MGCSNSYNIPLDCSVHPFCRETLNTLETVFKYKKGLFNIIQIIVDGEKNNKESKNEEESIAMNRCYGKFYDSIIESLHSYLVEEATKYDDGHKLKIQKFTTITHISSTSDIFKNGVKSLKLSIFLLNNSNNIMNFIEELDLLEMINKVNSHFQAKFDSNCEKYINDGVSVFKFMEKRWNKLLNTSKDNGESAKNDPFFNSNQDVKLKKKKEEFLNHFLELVNTCFKISIEDDKLNELFKDIIAINFYPILDYLESTNELKHISLSLDLNNNDNNIKNISLKEKIFSRMFSQK
jgi:hypothetical protein